MATATSDHVVETVEVPVHGMDCAGCTRSVQQALTKLPGVHSADVLLSSEKAIVRLDRSRVDLPAVRRAVAAAGYSSPEPHEAADESATAAAAAGARGFTRAVLGLFGVVFGAVLFIVVVGEWLGLFEALTERFRSRSAPPSSWRSASRSSATWSGRRCGARSSPTP
jgi:Cd2+/Zn2+-exporting ATPase/Cu+-exporting ATPase